MANTQIVQNEILTLPPVVDLDALDSISEQLIEQLECGSVNIDASSVDRVATNALLMLISAANSAEQANITLTISNPSEPMLGAIERLGLSENFAPLIKG